MKYKKYLVEEKDIARSTQHRWKRRIHRNGMKEQQNAVLYMLKNPQNQTSEELQDDSDSSVTDRLVSTSYQQQAMKESMEPNVASIQYNRVEADLQVLPHVEQKTTVYEEDPNDDGDEGIQHDRDITDERLVQSYSERALHEQKRKEHELLLLALKSKHCLTDEALEDILKVINAITGKHSVSTSKYHFYKNMNDYKDYIIIKHVCSECTILMENNGESVSCRSCCKQVDGKEHIKSGNFFIVLPLEAQLKNVIKQHDLSQLTGNSQVRANTDTIDDIWDGLLYKKVLKTPLNDCQNFSITFSCDGVPLFKSSSQSIWPVLCTLNELPPNLRSDHIMLTALWFGARKPPMNIFLSPFVNECINLHEHGFDWVTSDGVHGTSKVYALTLVSDSVARPLLQNFKQFNGEFGCSFCLQKGTLVERGKGKARVYPYEENVELRCPSQTLELVTRTVETGTSLFGVKGPSVLSLLPGFDIIESCVPDYMHSVLLGVTRSITSLWCNSENHQSPWYIGRSIPQIDQLLLKIKPPNNVSRTPRSIKERRYWKAHEWLMWLFFYSVPVLKGILPDKYLNHWIKLASGMALLLTTSITSHQLLEAQELLLQFVSEMHLYGVSNITYNVHLCLHLSRSVKNWGPLWAHSAFQFEAYNMKLINMVKSTQSVPMQICKVFWMENALPLYASHIMRSPSAECGDVFSHLVSKKNERKHAVRCQGVTAFGPPKRKMMENEDFIAMHNVAHRVEKQVVDYYERVVVNNVIIHSRAYNHERKRNSSIVCLRNDNAFFSVKTFMVADVGNGSNCYAIGNFFEEAKHNFSTCVQNPLNFYPVEKVLGHLTAIPASAIENKCLFIQLEKQKMYYIMTFLNYYEVTV